MLTAADTASDLAVYREDIERHENTIDHLYCDDRGLCTIGVGNLVPDAEAAALLPLRHRRDSSPATGNEKRTGFRAVRAYYKEGDNQAARAFRGLTDLYLEPIDIDRLYDWRMANEFLPGVRKICLAAGFGFDDLPLDARRALVDIAYNTGLVGLAKFHTLLSACALRRWETAAVACHRKTRKDPDSTFADPRNKWTRDLFLGLR